MIIDDYLLYKKSGIRLGNPGIKIDVLLMVYHLDFHLKDSIRCLLSFDDLNCYNRCLYGDINEKKNRIQYYHHYVISLLTNLGLIIDGQNELKKSIGGFLYKFELEKKSRNTIVHIFEKTKKYYDYGLKVNGFNVIEDVDDIKYRDIKTHLGTLDLLEKKFLIYGDNATNKDVNCIVPATIDLVTLKDELEKYLSEISSFKKYLNCYFMISTDCA